jgi:hypothetical protein
MKRAAIRSVVFILAVLPLSLYAAGIYRVTVTLYPGDDAAAVAKRLAATYRGELQQPVETAGDMFTMTLTLGAQEAALLARDPRVEAVQQISTAAMPSAPLHPVEAHTTTNWTSGDYACDGSGNIRKIGSCSSTTARTAWCERMRARGTNRSTRMTASATCIRC